MEEAKHLGHVISSNVTGYLDVTHIMSTFNKSVNILIACLGSVPANVLCKLFVQYCTYYYGIALCDLTSNMYQQLCVLWRKNVRRILRVPQRTHNRLLPLIAEIPSIDISCYSRIVKCYLSLLESTIIY